MPVKRRIFKNCDFHVTDKAWEIWLTVANAGLIRYEKLAAKLGLPVFVTMPHIQQLIKGWVGIDRKVEAECSNFI